MSYADKLNERRKARRLAPVVLVEKHELVVVPDLNPSRYPKHSDPTKGQVYGGVCNRTACDRTNATWWNLWTYGLYCRECARGINWQPRAPLVCISVEAKPELGTHRQLQSHARLV